MSTETKNTYRVKGINIRLAGKIYLIGRKIELTAEEAERLEEFLEALDEEEPGRDDSELSGLIEDNGRLTARIEELNSQLASRESDLDELTIELEGCKKQLGIEAEAKAIARDECAQLKQSYDEAKVQIQALQNELTALKAKPAKEGGKK